MSSLKGSLERIESLLTRGAAPRVEAEESLPRSSGLDKVAFEEAKRLGLSEEALKKLLPLLGKPPASLGTRGEGTRALPSRKATARGTSSSGPVLEETFEPEEAEEALPASSLPKVLSEPSGVLKEIMKGQRDPFANLLDTKMEGQGQRSAIRGVALRRELKRMFQEHPEVFSEYIEAAVKEKIAPDANRAIYAPEFIEKSALLGQNKQGILWAWLVAQIHKHICKGEVAQARALSGLCLCAAEQVSMDRGDWSLAMLLTFQSEPPYSTITSRKADVDQMEPHTQLADER